MNVLEKILEEIEERGNIQFSSYSKPLITVEDVLKIIRSYMNEAKDTNDDWIPVEDGLPEDERMVLVTYMTKSGIPSVDRARFDGKYWRGSGFMGRVIAWRPIPEPYKPKKDV